MSIESDRYELQALKDGFEALTRQAPTRDTGIAFTNEGCRRLGSLIARAAIDQHAKRPPQGRVIGPGRRT